MADAYATFGGFLLLKRRTQDALGTIWRAGEMERTGFKRIVWLRKFDQVGLDRAALTAEIAAANQLTQSLRASNVVRNSSYGTEGGVPYVAWDYVPAQPLDQLLARAAQDLVVDVERRAEDVVHPRDRDPDVERAAGGRSRLHRDAAGGRRQSRRRERGGRRRRVR